METKLFTLLLITIIFFSCSNDEPINGDLNPESTYLTVAEVKGIWTDTNNEHFFISISPDGKYSFCFNQELMGSGEYEIDKDSIIFNNNYLYITDKAKIEINNGVLILRGDFQLFKKTKTIYIDKQFNKTQEEFPPSIVGEQWSSLKYLTTNGDNKDYLNVITEYIMQYKKVKYSGSLTTTLKEQNWFYINRQDLLYAQPSNEDGEIHLYINVFNGEYYLPGSISRNEITF